MVIIISLKISVKYIYLVIGKRINGIIKSMNGMFIDILNFYRKKILGLLRL